jgi:hypothetical protein
MDPREDNTFADARTGLPISMLDFHDELMRTYFPDRPLNFLENRFEAQLTSNALRFWKGTDPRPADEPALLPIVWGCVFWMPRNNFYAHRFPEPLSQGRGSWSWPGYWRWQDARTPRQYQFGRFTSRRSDIEWTLNQVRWAVTISAKPGTVEVTMGTVTPDFDTFLVSVNGGKWKRSGARFAWKLRRGRNRLEMRVRNRAGVLGRASSLELDY